MWSDHETERDALGYTAYVEVLGDLCVHADLAPLTLGIFGAWGSGKTSLMRMLRRRIESRSDTKKVKALWFNAWRYEGRDEAQSALIHAILARLAEDKTLLQDAQDVFNRLKEGASVLKLGKFIGKSLMTMTPNIGELIDCFKEESEKIAETMERFHADFESLLKRGGVERIVVFIDDLDRCSSGKVIETFETIKLFLDTPSCTFVIGADADKIEHAVGEVYKVDEEQRRKDYLEKIIQIPFTIPQQQLKDIACYVGMLIVGRRLSDSAWKELAGARPSFYKADDIAKAFCAWPTNNPALFESATVVVKELQDVLPYVNSLARGLRGNPRQIKRFLNILALRRKLAEANQLDIQPDLLVKITVLEYVWEDFFNSLAETADPETGRSALLDEMLKSKDAKDSKPSASKLVSDSLGKAGLLEYLLLEPVLDGNTDLNPYLFLAQTSLSRGRAPAVVPAEEKAKTLARNIGSDDPIRSGAAARQAAAQEPAIAAAVVRILIADLGLAKEVVARTHIITGMQIVCTKHKDQYVHGVKALGQLDPAGNEAVAIAASTFLSEAKRAGLEVPDDLQERFTKGFKFAEAFARMTKPKRGK